MHYLHAEIVTLLTHRYMSAAQAVGLRAACERSLSVRRCATACTTRLKVALFRLDLLSAAHPNTDLCHNEARVETRKHVTYKY
jgi:hypothetical protein